MEPSDPSALIPFSNALLIPLIAVVINTTEVIPITIPNIVKMDLTLLERMALKAISIPSFSSKKKLFMFFSIDVQIISF